MSEPSSVFSVGQSVKALVTKVDKEKSQCTLSLKPSQTCNNSDGEESYVKSFFSDLDNIYGFAANSSGTDWSAFTPGKRVQGNKYLVLIEF